MFSIDVFIPCYEYAHFLRECVQSVLNQSGVDLRVLIIDDASPDHTEEVGRQLAIDDSRVLFRRHAVNRKHIATYNEGIDWATADCMLLLSADDYLLPGALHRACSLLEKTPAAGFVFGNAVVLHADGSRQDYRPLGGSGGGQALVLSGRDFIRRSGAVNIVPAPTAVVRTALQKRVGGYRPELPHSGDMEMWLRLASHGPVGFVDEPQAVYRKHAANMSEGYRDLADLHQRRMALELFFSTEAAQMASGVDIRRILSRSLARQAVGKASAAFNIGDMQASRAAALFALETWPAIRTSPAWGRLCVKRLVGPKGWQSLRSAKASLFGDSG
jgi:GT2 family glycosyltransferase